MYVQLNLKIKFKCLIIFKKAKYWFRVLNGSKIREPNRTEPNRTETEPMKKPKFYLQIILTVKIVVNEYLSLSVFRSVQRFSKYLEEFILVRFSVRFSSVLNSVQLGFRFNFWFRLFLSVAITKWLTLTLSMKSDGQPNYFNFHRFENLRTEPKTEPNRTENRRKKPNRWEL